MKKLLLIAILPVCVALAQFGLPSGLGLPTWKGTASDTNLLQLWLPLAEASGDAIASVGPNFPVTGSVGALSPGRGTFPTNNLFSHSDSFAPGIVSNDFTVTLWVKMSSIPESIPPVLIMSANGSTNGLIILGPSTNTVGGSCEFYVFGAGGLGPGLIRDDVVTTNVWHFIAAQYTTSPQNIALAFDNSSFTNNTFSFTPAAGTFTFGIGGKTPATNNLIAGPLDTGYLQHVRVFTRALSTGELTTLYNSGVPN